MKNILLCIGLALLPYSVASVEEQQKEFAFLRVKGGKNDVNGISLIVDTPTIKSNPYDIDLDEDVDELTQFEEDYSENEETATVTMIDPSASATPTAAPRKHCLCVFYFVKYNLTYNLTLIISSIFVFF